MEFGDARERLLVSRESYDLIVSEFLESVPRRHCQPLHAWKYYRAPSRHGSPPAACSCSGYRAMSPGQAGKTVYHTLLECSPIVSSRGGLAGLDQCLESREPLVFDAASHPGALDGATATALRDVAHGLEGLLARWPGGPTLARRRAMGTALNTDDRNALPRSLVFCARLGLPSCCRRWTRFLAARPRRKPTCPDLGEESVDLLAIEEEWVRIGLGKT